MRLKVKVRTGSNKQGVVKNNVGYTVSLKEKPENNKANLELLKLLRKYFGKQVRIVKGFKSREKIVEVK